ncbi:MAG: hypothetical protein IPK52_23775 [Chloroflexi bacterium]|nr:hypothetical protein [Chloroflexota bacterium]
MGILNEKERQALRDDLKGRSFRGAKWKLRLTDSKARLVYHRNSQEIGVWLTRFELKDAGVMVTLVEKNAYNAHKGGTVTSDYSFEDVMVDPLPGNKS